jgi:cytochrome c
MVPRNLRGRAAAGNAPALSPAVSIALSFGVPHCMDSMEVNKAIASVLVAGIAFMVSTLIADGLVHPTRLEHSAIKVEGVPSAATPSAPAPEQPIAALLASADVKEGESIAHKVCAACHTFEEGGKAGVGPNLYGVVGAPHGHMQGFDYSSALKGKQGPWTYDALNEWLKKPSAYAPGTKMTFPGLSSEKQRADVIAYLRTLSHNPEPLPPVPAQAATKAPAAAAAPATPAQPPIGPMIAAASPAEGEKLAQKYCAVCHSFNKGGKAIVGPNLWGVVGAPHGHMEGFNYSAALKGKQGPWTYEELNEWLTKPSAYAPGTLMAFAGLPKESERAAIIAYLRTLSDKPEPLPAAAAGPAKAAETANPQAGTAGAGEAPAPQQTPAEPKQGGAPATEGATAPAK